MKASVNGGAVTTLATGQATPTEIIVDPTYVTWFTKGDMTSKRIAK